MIPSAWNQAFGRTRSTASGEEPVIVKGWELLGACPPESDRAAAERIRRQYAQKAAGLGIVFKITLQRAADGYDRYFLWAKRKPARRR